MKRRPDIYLMILLSEMTNWGISIYRYWSAGIRREETGKLCGIKMTHTVRASQRLRCGKRGRGKGNESSIERQINLVTEKKRRRYRWATERRNEVKRKTLTIDRWITL